MVYLCKMDGCLIFTYSSYDSSETLAASRGFDIQVHQVIKRRASLGRWQLLPRQLHLIILK